ncbi:MAG: hypothetical protein AAFW60_03675 [Pseudomonadota bacterium]
MSIRRSVFFAMFAIASVSSCTSGSSANLTPDAKDKILADYEVTPKERRLQRSCITPDWRVVHGSTFTEQAYNARYSYVKRIGRNNGYLLEYNKSCKRLTRSGRVGLAIPLDCRGDIVRVRGVPCTIQSIYRVEDEQDARKLALVIERERLEQDPLVENEMVANLEQGADALP